MLDISRRCAAVGVAAMALTAHPAAKVEGTTLPGLGAGSAKAYAINSAGAAVGSATAVGGVVHAVVWHSRRVKDLTPTSTSTSIAFDINDSGQIVGRGGPFAKYGVLWRNGRTIVLPWPPDTLTFRVYECTATSINYIGYIGGYCNVDVNGSVIGLPVVWDHGVPDPVWDWGRVNAVSDRGHLAGRHDLDYEGDRFHAVLKDASGYHELPPMIPGGGVAQAFAINVDDLVVGQAEGRPVLWRDGKVRALAAVGAAYGVNRWGTIVGTAGASGRPTVWRHGSATTLARLSGAAQAINDTGKAVGWLTRADGTTVALRWANTR